MSTTFPLLSLFFLTLSIPAQAKGLSQKVQETYRKTDSFQASFVQTTFVEVLDREVRSRGRLVFAKPGRFLIHYVNGRERKFISNGKALWIVYPEEKEVEAYEDLSILSKEALVFLGGLGEMTQEFQVREVEKGRLRLTPKNPKSAFKEMLLKIDSKTFLVQETTLFPRSGNKSHYLFSEIQTNKPVPQRMFLWKGAGYRILKPLQ